MNMQKENLIKKLNKHDIPSDFGKKDGTPISNIDTILDDIDTVLGKGKPPSVEYIFVRSTSILPLWNGYGINFNLYGHAAVRYRSPEGKDIVVNIEGKNENKVMVRFYDAKDYLYGTKTGSDDQDTYRRNIVGVRVEELDQDDINKMHEYFLELAKTSGEGTTRFNIIFGPILNMIRTVSPIQLPEYGNCSKWISEGLYRAGVVTRVMVWPKAVFINIFENCKKTKAKSEDNVNVVYYEQPKFYDSMAKLVAIESVAPFQIIRGFFYADLSRFANVVSRIEENTMKARVIEAPFFKKQSDFRNKVNSHPFVIASVVGTSLLLRRGWKKAGKMIWNRHKKDMTDKIKQTDGYKDYIRLKKRIDRRVNNFKQQSQRKSQSMVKKVKGLFGF